MKLIIDIPENEYRHIKEYYEKNDIVEATYSYIYHGIPLKQGHWILDETDNSITCDKCGCLIWANDISNGEACYCPNCGCRMVEPQESDNCNQFSQG